MGKNPAMSFFPCIDAQQRRNRDAAGGLGRGCDKVCGHHSHQVHVTPASWEQVAAAWLMYIPLCSNLVPLSQSKRGGKCHVKAAQHFPHVSLLQGLLPGVKVNLYMLEYILYLPGLTDRSAVQPPAVYTSRSQAWSRDDILCAVTGIWPNKT